MQTFHNYNRCRISNIHLLISLPYIFSLSVRVFLICVSFSVFSLLSASAQTNAEQLQRYEFSHKQMGTVFRIILYTSDSTFARKAANQAFERIDQLNDILSDYKKDSELNRLSATAGTGQKVAVSEDLWRLLNTSTEAAKKSKGAFDITVGPYIKLWRRSRRQGELPSQEALVKARQAVGYQHIKIYPDTKSVELSIAGMQLDVGAIGKGYAVDEAMKTLRQQGITSALVDGGGNIMVSEAPPDKHGWQVEIGSLHQKEANPVDIQKLSLINRGMASSGDLYQYVEINGNRYSHIVDPRSGLGLTHQLMVTIIAPDATTADLLSTTVSVRGLQKSIRMLKKYKASACYLQYPDGKIKRWEAT